MRIPKYIYYLGGTVCSAVLDTKTNITVSKSNKEQFFRRELSGNVTFFGSDFMKIINTPVDNRIRFDIVRVNPDGSTATEYKGYFTKADCEIDFDNSYLTAKMSPYDEYEDFLYYSDMEHNLVDICPEMYDVSYYRKSFMQLYVAGSDHVTCVMGDNVWEQKCSSVTDRAELSGYGFAFINGNVNDYVLGRFISAEVTGQKDTSTYQGVYSSDGADSIWNNSKSFYLYYNRVNNTVELKYANGGVIFRSARIESDFGSFRLNGVPGTYGEGKFVDARIRDMSVYSRVLHSYETSGSRPIKEDDMVSDNRNYPYCVPFSGYEGQDGGNVRLGTISADMSLTPTKFGKYRPSGTYYKEPTSTNHYSKYIPIAQDTWNGASVWFDVGWWFEDGYGGSSGVKTILRDAYSIGSVISALIDANDQLSDHVRFEESTRCSKFLYSPVNPVTHMENERIFITQKTNILSSWYSKAAVKTPITLKRVLDMLRTTMNLFWYIEDGWLHIEHLSFFYNGGSYDYNNNQVGFDMTKFRDVRTGVVLSYGTNKVSFDTSSVPSEIKFEYDDESSPKFVGSTIRPVSGFADRSKKESWRVNGFSADIDRMLSSPDDMSKDGYAILGCYWNPSVDGVYSLTYNKSVQNSTFSLYNLLYQYLSYGQTFIKYIYNDVEYSIAERSKLMDQEVEFLYPSDIDCNKLIITDLGQGIIEKISLNLATRNHKILLKYDTAE